MAVEKKTLLLVDGNALIHRGFHAIPHLSTKRGEPTNGVYGFALLFLNAIKDVQPDYVAAGFDRAEPTFRDKLYEAYKAKRAAAPQELYDQIPRVKEMVEAFNVPVFEKAGYEADDIIGTVAKQADKQGLETIILTGDYDTLQLVNHNIKVLAPKKGLAETKLYGEKEVKEKYGLAPEQLIDYKALRGDPSDNIPGVAGVGEKSAVELLKKLESLDEIYQYLKDHPDGGEKIRPRVAGKLLEHKKEAYLSQKLARIIRDVPVKLDLKKSELRNFDEQRVVKIFQELEFKSLLARIPNSNLSPNLSPHSASSSWPRGRQERGGKRRYNLVDTQDKLEQFLVELKKQKEFAIDTETTSETAMEADLVGIGFGWKKEEAWYIPLHNSPNPSYLKRGTPPLNVRGGWEGLLEELKKTLADPRIKKIGHNIKYDYLVLKRAGFELAGISFDTMIAAYLLNPGARGFDLDTLVFTEFGFRMQPIEELIGPPPFKKKGGGQKTMAEVPVDNVAQYCCEDVDYTWRLKDRLARELKDKGLTKLLDDIELPLVPVLASMEHFGVKIEPKTLAKLSKEADQEINKIEKKIYRLAGQKFNIGSPIQLKEVLFEKLKIPTVDIKKGKTGFSTAATELEKLRDLHPIIELISEWREVSKLQNTYLDTLPELLNRETGRVHTSFNQTVAATGRLSSSDPNLQNIPIRTPLGRKVRRAFIAEQGFELVSVDYSQIELRIAAHLSGDKKMVKIFKEGRDIHEATAKEIGVSRRQAKVINFGILYGLSAYGLTSRIPEVSQTEAQEFIEKYKGAYPELIEYLDEVIDKTREQGYVQNELGRIRNLPEINSSQFQVRAAAERAAINMPLQSLAADIIKLAMIKLAERSLTSRDDCRLLLQVHDELLFEIKKERVKQHSKNIMQIMEDVYKFKVPLIVEAKSGQNWEEMQNLSLT